MRIRNRTLKYSGVIQGVGDSVLSPKTFATRAQLATMLMRYHTRGLLEE